MTDSDEYLKCREEVLKSFSPEFGQLGLDVLYFKSGGYGDINKWIERFNKSTQVDKFQELDVLVRRLVQCKPERAKEQPSTLLLRAIRLNNVDLFELFYEEGNSKDPPDYNKSMLYSLYESAIKYGTTDIVKYILSIPGFNGSIIFSPGYVSPLHFAILSLHKEIVQLLLDDKNFDSDDIIPDAIYFALDIKIIKGAKFEYEVDNEHHYKSKAYVKKEITNVIPLREDKVKILNDIICSLLDSLSSHIFVEKPLIIQTKCTATCMEKLFKYFISRRYSKIDDEKFLTKMLSMCDKSYLKNYYDRLEVELKKTFKTGDEILDEELLSLIRNIIRNNLSSFQKVVWKIFKGGYISKTRRILKSAKRRLKRTIRKRKYQITRRQPKQKYIK